MSQATDNYMAARTAMKKISDDFDALSIDCYTLASDLRTGTRGTVGPSGNMSGLPMTLSFTKKKINSTIISRVNSLPQMLIDLHNASADQDRAWGSLSAVEQANMAPPIKI